MDNPTYAEMEAALDKYFQNSWSSTTDAMSLEVQMYEIVKRLMADVQELKAPFKTFDVCGPDEVVQ